MPVQAGEDPSLVGKQVAGRLHTSLRTALTINGTPHHLTARISVAVADHRSQLDQALHAAAQPMLRASSSSKHQAAPTAPRLPRPAR